MGGKEHDFIVPNTSYKYFIVVFFGGDLSDGGWKKTEGGVSWKVFLPVVRFEGVRLPWWRLCHEEMGGWTGSVFRFECLYSYAIEFIGWMPWLSSQYICFNFNVVVDLAKVGTCMSTIIDCLHGVGRKG